MKTKHKNTTGCPCRMFAEIVAILLLVATLFCGCSASGTALLTLGEETIGVNDYELLLSRIKGKLEYNGYSVDSEDFWSTIISESGATYDDYFCYVILDEAKKMLQKLYIFEEVYGLTLPESNYTDIDTYINDILEYDFDGSETAFNRALSSYGANMKILRNNYVMEDKIEYLTEYIAGKTADTAKAEYYSSHYYCCQQILFPLYEYIYETDENGDLVYYQNGVNRICYDTTANPKTGTDGKLLVDANGDTIFYTEDGHIAYDTVNGELMAVDEDNDGYPDYRAYDTDTQAAIADQAKNLKALLTPGDYQMFKSYAVELMGSSAWSETPNGIFLSDAATYSVSYLADFQEALGGMQEGELALVQSDNAYHLIMKYPLPEGAYSDSDNEDWFTTFESELANSILDTMCAEYADKIVVDEDALEKAMNMSEIGSNVKY